MSPDAGPDESDASGLVSGSDGRSRCAWVGSAPDYVEYHDHEWGVPVRGDDALFERITLEAFQSGLSWLTILRKRPAFRDAFAGFAIDAVAQFDEIDEARLLADASIVRNEAKIRAAISNARAVQRMAERGTSLTELIWSFAPAAHRRPASGAEVVSSSAESTGLASALKKHGIVFIGPTTAYAMMQAVGVVDDHLLGCWRAVSL